MLAQAELFCVGFAAVVDTVLLLVVLERVNRPLTAIWLKWALVGTTFWHVSGFLHALLRETSGPAAVWMDALCMTAMVSGLLLLSCGILHAGLRINQTLAMSHPPTDRRYGFVYLPMLLIFVMTPIILRSGSRDFIAVTADFHGLYIGWLTFANLTAAWLFFRTRKRIDPESPAAGRFLVRFSLALIAVTALVHCYMSLPSSSVHEPWLRLLTNMSPLGPTLVFAYYISRRRLLPMVFEKTLVYGASLLAVIYLHRLTLSPLMRKYSQELQFDFVVVEGLVLVGLVLGYKPLRERFRESLRYLISGDVKKVRDATRELAVELSRRGGNDITNVSQWFTDSLMHALKLRHVVLSLPELPVECHALHDAEAMQSEVAGKAFPPAEIEIIASCLFDEENGHRIDRSRCRNVSQLAMMRDADLIAAFRIDYQNVQGVLLLGTLKTGDRLSEEQLNTTALLVDQYAATIHNRQLEEARQTAERRASQQEKLSTLGLLAGSLAHELKNPLSSIRTIATLLNEDLGTNSEHSKDVEMIVSEIDRLTQTTSRLLDFSRPADSTLTSVAPDHIIERLMHILGHLARQNSVKVTKDLNLHDVRVAATDATVTEILFNLIKNAIEAVTGLQAPQVTIQTAVDDLAVIIVSDNGHGIAPDMQQRIFEPFVTGKSDGTGLGLFVVAERVRELNGEIRCTSGETGTCFEVQIPLEV